MELGTTQSQIINLLSHSTHGDLKPYVEVTRAAAKENPEFLGHLIGWNFLKGQVRDSKVALPIITLSVAGYPKEFIENSLAYLALLSPRDLLRGTKFAKEIRQPGCSGQKPLTRLVTRYLREREASWFDWEHVAVQHRLAVKELYVRFKVKPSDQAKAILFRSANAKGEPNLRAPYPRGSVFEAIKNLDNMSASDAASVIIKRRIPSMIAARAMKSRIKDPDVLRALIDAMSPTELISNSKLLKKLGVRNIPALRGAYEAALLKAQAGGANTLKTSKAAEAVEADDAEMAAKLRALQEKQIDKVSSVDGNWLILADCSGSMSEAVEVARHLAAALGRFVKQKVHIIFFDEGPRYFNGTGKTLAELTEMTKHITAGGGTNMGCGLAYAIEHKLDIDGIVVISDGGENRPPWFAHYYTVAARDSKKTAPVYFLKLLGRDGDTFSGYCKQASIPVELRDLTKGVDYYAIPNIAQSLRCTRWSQADDILAAPLLTMDEVFGRLLSKRKERELAHA